MDINHVVIIGNLASDVELRTTKDGKHVASFRVAVNGAKGSDGKDSASFFSVVTWEKQAEIASQYLKKGARVGIDGKLQQRTWDEDGKKRSVVEIVANNYGGIQFLSKVEKKEEGQTIGETLPGYDDSPLMVDEIPY